MRSVVSSFSLVVLLGLAVASPPAAAWGAREHAVIGDMATAWLKPNATLVVADLLRDDLGVDGRPSGRATLGQVSNWADELRGSPAGEGTGPYHYDNIPVCGSADPAAYCPDGRCATAWFAKQVAILRDPAQPVRARNEALKWIVHLAGDLHQPLHVSNHDDRGGNDVAVTFLGRRADDPSRPYNLHGAWDRLIPDRMLDARGRDAAFVADLPDDAARKAWETGTTDDWVRETFAIARDFVYPKLPGGFACARPITATVDLDAGYVDPAQAIAAAQLRKAAVRLAKVLNDALGAP